MERVPQSLDLKRISAAQVARQKAEAFDRVGVTAWLRLLISLCPESMGRLAALESEADYTMGAQWFNSRYTDCPVMLETAVVPEMTMERMLKLGPRGEIMKALGTGYLEGKPLAVLFSSPADGMPLMCAHVDPGVEVFSYQVVTRVKAADLDMVVRLQPAKDVATHVVNNLGWQIYT